jgi:glycosyltransferase involved in cell wall biosynthesis
VHLGCRIAVVMPAFEVADRIVEAVGSVPAFVDHLVVVDDGSHDRTAELVAGLDRPGLHLTRHGQNRGVGAAIATGYAEALRLGAEVIAVMAGDGQMDPADLAALVTPVATGRADYAKGNRFRRREVWRVMPRDRLVGNILLSLLTKLTSGYWRSFDSQCGYTAISRRALQSLGGGFFARYGYPNDLLARLRAVDARLAEVPVRPVYDGQRSGIRIWTVGYPILFVLLRSLGRRLWRRHLRPLLLGEPAPTLLLGRGSTRGPAPAPAAPRRLPAADTADERLLPAPPP